MDVLQVDQGVALEHVPEEGRQASLARDPEGNVFRVTDTQTALTVEALRNLG